MSLVQNLITIVINKIYILPVLLFCITLHELAHGYTAYLLGDNTAKINKRLTINPLRHIDLTGFLLLLIVGFGWAKPVPINPYNFKNRKRGVFIVSISGPLANLIISIFLALLLSNRLITNSILFQYLEIVLWYNVVLGIFNLLPFPPLDGSKILYSILPERFEYFLISYEKYMYLILIFLVLTDKIDNMLNPLIKWWFKLLMLL